MMGGIILILWRKMGRDISCHPWKMKQFKEVQDQALCWCLEKNCYRKFRNWKDLHFVLIGKPKVILTSTNLDDFPDEVKTFLDEYADIIVDEFPNELPPVRSISHHIELIPGAILPNKPSL